MSKTTGCCCGPTKSNWARSRNCWSSWANCRPGRQSGSRAGPGPEAWRTRSSCWNESARPGPRWRRTSCLCRRPAPPPRSSRPSRERSLLRRATAVRPQTAERRPRRFASPTCSWPRRVRSPVRRPPRGISDHRTDPPRHRPTCRRSHPRRSGRSRRTPLRRPPRAAEPPPVHVTIDPDGRLVISSQDTEALDLLEELFGQALAPPQGVPPVPAEIRLRYWVRLNLEELLQGRRERGQRQSRRNYFFDHSPPRRRRRSLPAVARQQLKFIDDLDTNTCWSWGPMPSSCGRSRN